MSKRSQQLKANAAAARRRRSAAAKKTAVTNSRPSKRTIRTTQVKQPTVRKTVSGRDRLPPDKRKSSARAKTNAPLRPSTSSTLARGSLASEYLGLVNLLPADQRNTMLGFFSQFNTLDTADQEAFIANLNDMANSAVDPFFDEQQRRADETFGFDVESLDMQRRHLQNTFDRLASDIEQIRKRDVYKEQRDLSKSIFALTNDEFIGNVAGSGIARRRKAFRREDSDQNITDINIGAEQRTSRAYEALGQDLQTLDLKQRQLYANKSNLDFDINQDRTFERQSSFLDFFANEVGDIGESVRRNIDTGATGSLLNGSASNASDKDRKARYTAEVAAKDRTSRINALKTQRAQEDKDADEILYLNQLKSILNLQGRSSYDAKIDERIRTLTPSLSKITSQAKLGTYSQDEIDFGLTNRSLYGDSGTGILGGMDEVNRRTDFFLKQFRQGNSYDRQKLNSFLQSSRSKQLLSSL